MVIRSPALPPVRRRLDVCGSRQRRPDLPPRWDRLPRNLGGGGSVCDSKTGTVTAIAGIQLHRRPTMMLAVPSVPRPAAVRRPIDTMPTRRSRIQSQRASNAAIGPLAVSTGANSVALGNGATAGNANDVALGAGSVTAAPNVGAYTLNGGAPAGTTVASVVSVGAAGSERQLTNVGAGVVSATSTDAINGSQLFTVATAVNNLGASAATALGGGIVINPDGTTKISPSYNVDGTAYSNVGAAIAALDKASGAAIDTNNTSALANPTATGTDATAISPGAVASGADSLAAGKNALASGDQAVAMGPDSKATGIGATALGNGAQSNGRFIHGSRR
ncbi:MAG: hypothetical protein HOP09_08085 [Hyphomicrobium sp.]|nr:hypothetical protein [Hyphomicrobium sp.]